MSDIIIISGKQGSGKTTLMKEITNSYAKHGQVPVDLIFANTIYQIHNYAIKLLEEKGIKRDIVKDGFLLQFLGTEWGRKTIDEDIWVKCLLGEIENLKKFNPDENLVFLISDCRFKNEFDGIPTACKIRLEAGKEVRKERCSQWRENDTHASEIDLDDYAREGKFNIYLDTEQPKQKVLEQLYSGLLLWAVHPNMTGIGFDQVKEKYYV